MKTDSSDAVYSNSEYGRLLYADLYACAENNLCKSRIARIQLSPECYSSKTLTICFKTEA